MILLFQPVKDLDSKQRNGLTERDVKVNNHNSELVRFPWKPCMFLPVLTFTTGNVC